MAHGEADHGSVEGEQHYVLGQHELPSRTLRWVCGAGPPPVETEPVDEAPEPEVAADEGRAVRPEPSGPPACRADRKGWAGAHRHGAVRPRARATRRERPPDRWC